MESIAQLTQFLMLGTGKRKKYARGLTKVSVTEETDAILTITVLDVENGDMACISVGIKNLCRTPEQE